MCVYVYVTTLNMMSRRSASEPLTSGFLVEHASPPYRRPKRRTVRQVPAASWRLELLTFLGVTGAGLEAPWNNRGSSHMLPPKTPFKLRSSCAFRFFTCEAFASAISYLLAAFSAKHVGFQVRNAAEAFLHPYEWPTHSLLIGWPTCMSPDVSSW